MGVDELDLGAAPRAARQEPGSAPPPRASAGDAEPSSVQRGLFGNEASVVDSRPPRGRPAAPPGRGADSSPLARAQAPDAPDAAAGLDRIRGEIGDCRRCRLSEKRTNIVFGVGSPTARLMFIGEGPGVDEDRQGEPFVGRAGQLVTRIIEWMGFARQDVYIANVVKCRPPENRTPLPDEIGTCSPFLFQQAAAIRPRVIVCLGTPAAQTVLGTRDTITRLRGSFHDAGGFKIMPTFHPAYLLRNPAAKKEVWEDMKKVVAFLKTEE